MSLSVSEIKLNDENIKFVGVLKDISAKKQADFYLSSIANIQRQYIAGLDQYELFDLILSFLLKYTGSEYGFIGSILKDDNGQPYLKTYAITNIAWNKETQAFYEKNAPNGLEFKNLNTLFGHTIRTGEVVIANNPSDDPRAGGLPKGHPEMNSYLGMPIYGNKGLIAMFGIANKKGGYNENDSHELTALTTVMASIIESSNNASIIEKMANVDSLTGAYNRFYFKSRTSEMLEQKIKSNDKSHIFIMMIDLDKFKHINDYYGHEYGDHVLKEFVARLKQLIKKQDLIARIGGDEFVVVSHISKSSDAGRIAERIVNASKEPYIYEGKEFICQASVGIASYPESGNDVNSILRDADLALYKSKASKGGYAYFSEELQTKYLEQQRLEKDILLAFERNEFFLMFQPIVSLITGNIYGCEALVRWKHPKFGIVPPIKFIEVIETMGLAGELNLYVINACLEKCIECNLSAKEFYVAINISPHTHDLENNMNNIVALFDKCKPNQNVHFNLEITEANFMKKNVDLGEKSPIIHLLKKHNIGLVLDDFGVEYSSITRLLASHFDTIKIDISFTQKLDCPDTANAAKVTIEAIMHLARGLNIKVIAEGIETQEQADILKSLGCELAQGYHFYKPLSFEDMSGLLQH